MADKIVKAFEALRSHYLQESTAQQPTVEAESPASGKVKKDVSLLPQERINYCNAIADFLPMQTVKNINEFPRLLTLAMELLLVCCDDKEADVRLVAGECINKIMKAFLDSNFGRIQVELYKEIKKNGPSRSLRAALQRFGETCHLIRVHKCRPYIANLLPCIVKIVKREDDSVQEVLGTMMLKLCPVLGMFMNEHDIKILLKSFLPNLASASATTRRTAASTLNTLCKHSRKPAHFYSWLVNMLLASITPLTNELPAHTILGALLCFRNIVPNLGECCVEMQGMKDSFGLRAKKNEAATVKDLVLEKKQFHQIYEVTMFCTKHTDHNIVTAALENLYQILSSKAKPMLEILLSSNGIAPTITGNAQSLVVDSGISDDSMSMGSVSLSDKLKLDELSISTSDSGLSELGQSMESTLFSAIQVESDCKEDLDLSSIRESDDVVNESDLFEDSDVERPLPLSIPASFTDGEIPDNSARETRLGTNISDIPDHDSLASFEEHRRDETTSLDSSTIIERQFNFDAVTCSGVPLLHCVRLMCSFLLNGEPGNVLSDSKTRVSIKSLALNCISLALNLYPEAIYPKVMPANIADSSDNEVSTQLIRDILLLKTHEDPQIRGAVSTIIGQFLSAGMHISVGDFDQWNLRMSEKYSTECVDLLEYIKVLANMLSDESAIVIKQSCLAVKSCINILCHSTYSLYGYELIWNLLFLGDMSYWLVKVEVMEVFQMLDYRLMSILELIWIKEKKLSNVNYKFRNLQQQVINNIVMVMLGDEDARVRYSAANCCVNIIPNLYCVTAQDGIVSSSHKSLHCGNMSYMVPPEEWRKCKVEIKANIEKNLSFLIRKVTEQLRVAGTKYLTHGCTQCLYLLSETFSVINYPLSWELLPVTLLNPSAVKSPSISQSVNTFVPVTSGPQSMIKSTSSYGLQYIIFDLISATWMTLDLQAHTEALKLGIHLLCGTSNYYLQKKDVQNGITDGCGGWLTSDDPQLKSHADKMFVHCMRLLNILTHVVEQTNPSATAPKQSNSTPVKDKEKGSGASGRDSPAPTTPQTSVPSAVPQNPDSPKKFSLAKALQKKQEPPSEENKNTPGNVPSETKQSAPQSSGQSSERVGLFQHDSHLVKLHDVLKGSFKNYQVSSVHRLQDKFCSFMRGVLESFSLLVELATFTELGSHAEEILEYLKATAGLEEEASLLAVQQLLKGLFGTNSASQPETYELATSTTHLVETMGDPTFYQDTNHPINHYSDIYSNYIGLYGEGFLKSYNDFCLSLKLVPQVEVSVEKGSLSILKFFKKNMLSNRPTAKVSKDRVSSIQSYIRLFEPLVIHALKSYTTTSSIQLQCQAIHLLNQLIRLRVNYSLLDSDQVFIGFVLKQFEFIDNGQVSQPQLFIPTIFQFLVLLSYECFQQKFASAKAIIGMPRIIQLCNDVMACGLPPVSYAIPALKPIVQDLFASQSQARPDSSKDLDTQREVVVSMLLRVIQYPEVLSLLTHVLNGSKSDDDKWKRLSRQVVDVFLPSLSKLDVNVTSVNSLLLLFNLLDSVAPLALRPADIILKALFDGNIPANEAEVIRFISMVIGLMRTLIMQNSEDIIFSRMQQLDVSYIRTCFSTNNEKFQLISTKSESNAADYLSSFLVFTLRVSVEKLLEKSCDVTADRTQLCMLSEIIKMYFELLVYLAKCGLFKKLTSSLVSLLFSPNQTSIGGHSIKSDDSTSIPPETDSASITLLTEMTNKLFMLKSVEPLMSLKWIYVVRSLGISDTEFWWQFHHIWTNGKKDVSMINDRWKAELIQHGSLMLYCDITLSRLKEQKDVDHSIIGQFLKGNMRDVLYLMTELPVKELVSRILQQAELSTYFIESLSELVTNDFSLVKPTMLKFILGLLESIDLTYSSGVVHLLLKILPKVTVYGLSRKAETLACRRLEIEYIASLEPDGNELPNSELAAFGLHKLHSKRYPRLCALIQRITKRNTAKHQDQQVQSPTVSHPLAAPQLDVEKYKISKEWMYNFVENSCLSKSETLHKSSIYLLRSIELNQIEKVMLSPEFDVTLLELCIDAAFSSEQYLRLHYRLTTSNQLSLRLEHESMYDAVGTTEEENKDKLLDISKGLVLKHVADILNKFRDEETYDSKVYFSFNQKQVDQLGSEPDSIRHYLIFIRCLIKLLGQTSAFNQTWYMSSSEANGIIEYILLLPLLCVYELKNKSNASIMLIQLCFQSLSLILHCEDFSVCLSNETYACVLIHTVSCIHEIVAQLTMQPGEAGELERHSIYNSPPSDDNPTGQVANRFQTGCLKVSSFFQSLRGIFAHGNSDTTLPSLLIQPLQQVITGLARLTIVNSYTRVPPIVWQFGWTPESEGPFLTELPPLPVDILKEKDVLKEFILRVNHVGWVSRMQFEETWAALLGVLSSIPIVDDISTDEEIELAQSSSLVIHCITSLLLDTMLSPSPGNFAISQFSVVHRQRDYPFLGSKAGKKLVAVRNEIEIQFCDFFLSKEQKKYKFVHPVVPSLLSAKLRKQYLQYGCMMRRRLFISNLELPLDHQTFNLGQVSAAAIRTRLVTSDTQENTDSDDSDSLIIALKDNPSPFTTQPADAYRKLEELDIRSCLQFLLELFEQWLSPFANPRTPLMLKMQAIKSLCVLSDLFLELNHYEWILGILLDFSQNHHSEDEITMQYLVPTMCKALAVLKLEGATAERICKQVETYLKSPHLPLQISSLVGSLYILETLVNSTVVILAPILTEYITKKLNSPIDPSSIISHRYSVVLWSVAFYLIENCSSEIQDAQFPVLVLDNAIQELNKATNESSPSLMFVIFQGLERLVVSFSLTRPECEEVAKVAAHWVYHGSTRMVLSALGLLCTCMYTGKESDHASGLAGNDIVIDAPMTESRLVMMERMNILLSRIRKGQLSEAVLLATILPRILLDFLPVQEVMNKLIAEFLSSQQPRPELIAKIFNKVSDLLYKENEDALICEWVFLCVGSFVQRTPLCMAIWSLTCFFISASTNPWLKSTFPFIVERKGKLDNKDKEIFCIAALDFYLNPNLTDAQRDQFLQTFRSKTESLPSSPYENLINCCMQARSKHK